MPRTPHFPAYPKKPHASKQARIVVGGTTYYLGVHGSPESWAEYQRLLTHWRETGCTDSAGKRPSYSKNNSTVGAIACQFMTYAERHYRHPDGTPKDELNQFRTALRPLLRLHAATPAAAFGPKALRAVQAAMASGSWQGDAERAESLRRGRTGAWCRRVVNRHTTRIKTVWRWAESEELVPAGSLHGLLTVRGLRPGEHGASDRPEVPPVPEDDLAKVLPCLGRIPRAVLEVLLLTGARPSEILRLTPDGLDRSGSVEVARGIRVPLGAVWAYQPARHKTAWKGHRRVVLFGPKAQAVLAPFLDRPADAYLFSPREASEEYLRSTRRRVRHGRKRQPGARYTPASLQKAVVKACRRAGVPAFTCYQLRHLAATRLAAEFGVELARIVLGHKDLSVTGLYVLDNYQKAAEAMGRVG